MSTAYSFSAVFDFVLWLFCYRLYSFTTVVWLDRHLLKCSVTFMFSWFGTFCVCFLFSSCSHNWGCCVFLVFCKWGFFFFKENWRREVITPPSWLHLEDRSSPRSLVPHSNPSNRHNFLQRWLSDWKKCGRGLTTSYYVRTTEGQTEQSQWDQQEVQRQGKAGCRDKLWKRRLNLFINHSG